MQMNKHQKKYLYDSIMKQVAKTVKNSLNESFEFDEINTNDKNKNLTNIYKAEVEKQRNILKNKVFNGLCTFLTADTDDKEYEIACKEFRENVFANISLIQDIPDEIIGNIVKEILNKSFDYFEEENPAEAWKLTHPAINDGETFELNTKFGIITVKLEYEEGSEYTCPTGYENAYIYDSDGNEYDISPLCGCSYELISDFIYKKITPEMKQELKELIEEVFDEEKE